MDPVRIFVLLAAPKHEISIPDIDLIHQTVVRSCSLNSKIFFQSATDKTRIAQGNYLKAKSANNIFFKLFLYELSEWLLTLVIIYKYGELSANSLRIKWQNVSLSDLLGGSEACLGQSFSRGTV
jgi:hypothetical protein